jgi:hypothetical protein
MNSSKMLPSFTPAASSTTAHSSTPISTAVPSTAVPCQADAFWRTAMV